MFYYSLFCGPLQGIDSGFAAGQDDMYTVYDKPWRPGGGAADHIYRPSKTADSDVYGDDVEKLIKANRSEWGTHTHTNVCMLSSIVCML